MLDLALGERVSWSEAAPLPAGGVVIAVREAEGSIEGELVQLRADGSLDPAFGTGGVAPLATRSTAMARSPDGKIYVARSGSDSRVFSVRRYTAAGAPDSGFGSNGELAITVRPTAQPGDKALPTDVLVDAQGRILIIGVAGPIFGPVQGRVTVARLTPQGTLDSTYGAAGVAQFAQDDPAGMSLQVVGAGLAGDGDLLVAGQWNSVTQRVMRVVRLDPGGAPDGGFGGAGWVSVGPSDPAGFVSISAVTGQPAGRVLVLGCCPMRVVGLRADGALDTSWGTAGTARWEGDHRAHALLVRSDGGVVAVGEGGQEGRLLGLTANGAVDPEFGFRGVLQTRGVVATSAAEPAPGRLVATAMIPTVYEPPYPLIVDAFRRQAPSPAPTPTPSPGPVTTPGPGPVTTPGPPPGWVQPPGWSGSPGSPQGAAPGPPHPSPMNAATAALASNLRPAIGALGRARRFARRGLRLTMSSPGPGSLRLVVLRGTKRLASGTAATPAVGSFRIVAKPRAAARALRRVRAPVKVLVRLTWTDKDGEIAPITVSRSAKLRP
jgi:uncharacterized delta-60 repeat protein